MIKRVKLSDSIRFSICRSDNGMMYLIEGPEEPLVDAAANNEFDWVAASEPYRHLMQRARNFLADAKTAAAKEKIPVDLKDS